LYINYFELDNDIKDFNFMISIRFLSQITVF
jgi:hypothetical protein